MRSFGGERFGFAERLAWDGADSSTAAAGVLDSGQDIGTARNDDWLARDVGLGSWPCFDTGCLRRAICGRYADYCCDGGGIQLAISEAGGPATGDDLSQSGQLGASGVWEQRHVRERFAGGKRDSVAFARRE